MNDWEVALENLCCDLVSQRDFEPLLAQLFVKDSSQWTPLMSLAQSSSIDLSHFADIASQLYIVWLSHPTGGSGYAVVIFYDFDSKWTKGADYNRVRLLGQSQATQEDSE